MSPRDEECAVCSKKITKSTGSVRCQGCKNWYHPSCVMVSIDLVNAMSKSKGLITYTCVTCSETPPDSVNPGTMSLHDELRVGLADIQTKFDTILAEVKLELGTKLSELTKSIDICNKKIDSVELSSNKRIKNLEDQNEILHKRLNRADIIINGFSQNQADIYAIALKIFEELKVDVCDSDISLCCFINNGFSVLVKFNSISKRDLIMSNYFKTRSLKVSTFVATGPGKQVDIHKRVFLNDHLSAKAGRLCYLCRKLRRNKKISKFRLLNSDVPKVKITFGDNTSNVFDLAELSSAFDFDEVQTISDF